MSIGTNALQLVPYAANVIDQATGQPHASKQNKHPNAISPGSDIMPDSPQTNMPGMDDNTDLDAELLDKANQ